MSDPRIPFVVSALALFFAIAVLIYKSAPTAQAQAPSNVPPGAETSTSTSPPIVPIGVGALGARSVAFFVEPSTRTVFACAHVGTAGNQPICSSSKY